MERIRTGAGVAMLCMAMLVIPGYSFDGKNEEAKVNVPYYEKEFSVAESDSGVEVNFNLKKGDRIVMHADGLIWAGVWFTGSNGPNGWNNCDNDPKFPLPGAHPFSLIIKIDDKYREAGTGLEFNYTGEGCKPVLRTNDDTPGGGNGAFRVSFKVYRKAD